MQQIDISTLTQTQLKAIKQALTIEYANIKNDFSSVSSEDYPDDIILELANIIKTINEIKYSLETVKIQPLVEG